MANEKSEQRKWRIGEIIKAIQRANEQNKVVFEEKLVAEAVTMFNVSVRTIKDYLNELEMRRVIVRYMGEVWIKNVWDEIGHILTEQGSLFDEEGEAMEKERKERIDKFEEGKEWKNSELKR